MQIDVSNTSLEARFVGDASLVGPLRSHLDRTVTDTNAREEQLRAKQERTRAESARRADEQEDEARDMTAAFREPKSD